MLRPTLPPPRPQTRPVAARIRPLGVRAGGSGSAMCAGSRTSGCVWPLHSAPKQRSVTRRVRGSTCSQQPFRPWCWWKGQSCSCDPRLKRHPVRHTSLGSSKPVQPPSWPFDGRLTQKLEQRIVWPPGCVPLAAPGRFGALVADRPQLCRALLRRRSPNRMVAPAVCSPRYLRVWSRVPLAQASPAVRAGRSLTTPWWWRRRDWCTPETKNGNTQERGRH
jgi:hypothetical protein